MVVLPGQSLQRRRVAVDIARPLVEASEQLVNLEEDANSVADALLGLHARREKDAEAVEDIEEPLDALIAGDGCGGGGGGGGGASGAGGDGHRARRHLEQIRQRHRRQQRRHKVALLAEQQPVVARLNRERGGRQQRGLRVFLVLEFVRVVAEKDEHAADLPLHADQRVRVGGEHGLGAVGRVAVVDGQQVLHRVLERDEELLRVLAGLELGREEVLGRAVLLVVIEDRAEG